MPLKYAPQQVHPASMGIVGSQGSAGVMMGEGGKGDPLPGTLREGSGCITPFEGPSGRVEVEPITSRPRQPGRNGSRCRLAPLKAGSVEGWLSMAKMRVERTFLQSGEGEESRPQKSAKLPSSSLQLGCPWEMREASAGTQEAPRHGRGPL